MYTCLEIVLLCFVILLTEIIHIEFALSTAKSSQLLIEPKLKGDGDNSNQIYIEISYSTFFLFKIHIQARFLKVPFLNTLLD